MHMNMASGSAVDWVGRMKTFSSDFLAGHGVLAKAAGCASVLLHGSTTLGIDDQWSDLDAWILLPAGALSELRQTSNDWFFEFSLDGKPGHFTLEPQEGFEQRVRTCDFPLIAELRHAVVLADPSGAGRRLIDLARTPMRPEVRRAWFCYHYVEMRGEHRAIDNPIERGDPVAVLVALTKALEHAMQAALVLDGEPYPYSKWLARACEGTPTGRSVLAPITEMLDLLGRGDLRRPGPEKGHPLSDKLRDIRRTLVAAARAGGLDELWLDKWWLFCEQARAMRDVPWCKD
jgi:hypothetical protein